MSLTHFPRHFAIPRLLSQCTTAPLAASNVRRVMIKSLKRVKTGSSQPYQGP